MDSSSLKASVAPVRVMLVDDSAVVRGMIAQTLAPDATIVATAANGAQAIPLATQHRPDVIVLDVEMPEMDGLTALPKLLEASPNTRIIMASTLTQRNADISLQALSLGACDYIAKPTSMGGGTVLQDFQRELRQKVMALGSARKTHVVTIPKPVAVASAPARRMLVRAIAIASSTGGPQALMTVLGGLKGKFLDIPIFITQHMPPMFTTILADHLTRASGRPCHECKDGEVVQPGRIYLAPGDFHMTVEKQGGAIIAYTNQQPAENFCRPAADPMLRSLSTAYGSGLLTLVLTGMGSDGLEGAKAVTAAGGAVIAQDEATSVVWGMPRAVAEKGLCRAVLPLSEIASYIIKATGHAL
ncbi:MAG: chemotaxis response regulator protein-glutamate methylesterase [Pseudomonadota bacterium]|nr:chemotaxis response regulator protein-glutamate methylesterase [Pseudomonadota bacterium]